MVASGVEFRRAAIRDSVITIGYSTADTAAINPIIFSELSMAFARIEELEAVRPS
jgi:hypothetical protein